MPVLGAKVGLFRFFGDPIGCLQKIYSEFGLIGSITDGDTSLVCAFGADNNQQLLSNQRLFFNWAEVPFKVPADSSLVRLNTALTSMNGDMHRRHRRLLMPAFSKQTINGYRDDVVGVTERYLARWEGKRSLDILPEMRELTLSVAMRCLFGLDVEEEAAELGHQGEQFLAYLTSLGVMLFPFDLPGTPYGRFRKLGDQLETRILQMIHERRQLTHQKHDVLSLLINAHDEDGSSLSDSELVGHTNVLFIAAHETTAFTLTWTLFLLSQHTEVFAALVDELAGTLHGAAPTLEQIAQLTLLDWVVKESMRLLPPTPFLFLREATSDFKLGPYVMPKKSMVVLSPLITHRIPSVFDEPNRFRPDRWATITPSLYEYLPFGAGPRMCIGAGFAAMAVRVILPMIIQRYRLALQPQSTISYKVQGITMGPKFGMPMQLAPQDGTFARPNPALGTIHELVDLPKLSSS